MVRIVTPPTRRGKGREARRVAPKIAPTAVCRQPVRLAGRKQSVTEGGRRGRRGVRWDA